MTKRVLLLDDDQLDIVIEWAEKVRDDGLDRYDFEEDEEETLEAIRAARLAP